MEFKIVKKSKASRARLGVLKTSHGEVQTPCLVPVATQAAIKTLTSEQVRETKSQILICNAFHLRSISGDLHELMNWPRPLMTDSGGFQIFSLGFGRDLKIGKMLNKREPLSIKPGRQPAFLKIVRNGVFFRSPLDGQEIFLGPEQSIKIQEKLGADIIFAFDECPPPVADYAYTKKSLETTHRWAKVCLESKRSKQALFGVVQGGKFKDLRIESAKFIGKLDFDGFGIGGELGFNKKEMFSMLRWVTAVLPEEKPRHLLGNGHIDDLTGIFKSGVDTIDCVVPTHYARHGVAFILGNKLDLAKRIFLKDKKPLDKNCQCSVCQSYSRSYLCHLLRAKEITALALLTIHNLYFFNAFIEKIREKIKQGKL